MSWIYPSLGLFLDDNAGVWEWRGWAWGHREGEGWEYIGPGAEEPGVLGWTFLGASQYGWKQRASHGSKTFSIP